MLADLLMDIAKMTGSQPDFSTGLIAGERPATAIQTGISSRKKPQTVGGRNHMSVGRVLIVTLVSTVNEFEYRTQLGGETQCAATD